MSASVYPNPARDVVTVSLKTANSSDVTVRVLNLGGKEVARTTQSNVNGRYEGRLQIGHLANGVYMVEVNDGEMSGRR
ncbi:MAG: T9SS type A sorting domain-containing protein [Owenweeksia sp.]|nr:T9SS type A sorting domain-containing protein [Owenweeksia sp.]